MIFLIFSFSLAQMDLITLPSFSAVSLLPTALLCSTVLHIPCYPYRAACSHPVHFPQPLPKSQILGKTPTVCGWTKQLHRNSNRSKAGSLSDVMDSPRPWLLLSISLSLSYKRKNMSSPHAEIDCQSVLQYQSTGLQKTQCSHICLSEYLHIPWEGRDMNLWKTST